MMTEAGADAFIGDGRGFKGFSSNIESVNTIRQKKRISKQETKLHRLRNINLKKFNCVFFLLMDA